MVTHNLVSQQKNFKTMMITAYITKMKKKTKIIIKFAAAIKNPNKIFCKRNPSQMRKKYYMSVLIKSRNQQQKIGQTHIKAGFFKIMFVSFIHYLSFVAIFSVWMDHRCWGGVKLCY